MATTASMPWARILAEGVLIVSSILLALAADSWLEERQDREEERTTLEGIYEQLIESKRILESNIEINERSLAATQTMIAATEPGVERSLVPDSVVWLQARTTVNELPLSRFQALISSGRLVLIRDPDLRAAIAGWPTHAGAPSEPASRRRTFWQNAFVPYLRRGYELEDWLEPPSGVPLDIGPDSELENLFRERSFYDGVTLGAERSALAELDALLARIAEVLAEST